MSSNWLYLNSYIHVCKGKTQCGEKCMQVRKLSRKDEWVAEAQKREEQERFEEKEFHVAGTEDI